MICPNKNSPEWKALVATYGEALALIKFRQQEQNNNFESDVYNELLKQVTANKDFISEKYSTYLGSKDMSAEQMASVFYSRFSGLSPKLKGDIVSTSNGDMLLFPEVEAYVSQKINPPTTLGDLLGKLQEKYNIPFVVINDPKQKFKGRFVNQGERKIVVINIAYATEDTPLHEYYHPFVRMMRLQSPQTFELILNSAKKHNKLETDPEEVVTDFLAKQAAKGNLSLFLNYFLDYIKKILGLTNNLAVSSKLRDIFKVLDSNIDLSQENSLMSAYQKIDEITDLIGRKMPDRISQYVNYVEKLIKEGSQLKTSDSSSFYQDINGKDIAKRLTAFIGDKVYGEFSKKAKKYADSPAEAGARKFFKEYGINVDGIPVNEITETITLEGEIIKFSDVVAFKEKEFNKHRLFGKLVHSFLQYKLETDPGARATIKTQALEYAKEYGTPFTTLETHPDLYNIDQNIQQIIDKTGIIVDLEGTKGIPKAKQDKVAPELSIVSELLTDKEGNKLGTTADGFVQHYNGEVTLVD
jgi:hypothetical protein